MSTGKKTMVETKYTMEEDASTVEAVLDRLTRRFAQLKDDGWYPLGDIHIDDSGSYGGMTVSADGMSGTSRKIVGTMTLVKVVDL